MGKTALVISGGGCKGAFAVGILKYIKDNRPNITFDILCGTSTGALITPLAATGEIDLLEQIYSSKSTKDLLTKKNLIQAFASDISLFDPDGLTKLVVSHLDNTRFNSIMNSGKEIFISTVCLNTGRVVYFTNSQIAGTVDYDIEKLHDVDTLRNSVLASAFQPVFMPPVKIGAFQYVDGGIREYMPIKAAIDAGAEDIYAIILTSEKEISHFPLYNSLDAILFRTIDLFSEDVAVNDLRIAELYSSGTKFQQELKQKLINDYGLSPDNADSLFDSGSNPYSGKGPINIYVFRPDRKLADNNLEFEINKMKANIAYGREVAEDNFTRGFA